MAGVLLRRDADPGMARRVAPAQGQEVAHDRLQRIDRDEHVAGEATSSAAASPTNSEPIPTSLPSRSIRAAPAKAGCGGVVEQGVGQEVFPVARELAPADEADLPPAETAVAAEDQERVADRDPAAAAQRHRLRRQGLQRSSPNPVSWS